MSMLVLVFDLCVGKGGVKQQVVTYPWSTCCDGKQQVRPKVDLLFAVCFVLVCAVLVQMFRHHVDVEIKRLNFLLGKWMSDLLVF